MKNKCTLMFLISIILLMMANMVRAGSPMFTFTPLTQTTLSVPKNEISSVMYIVTNQSNKQRSLALHAITGITQTTTGRGVCTNPFVLGPVGSTTQSCLLVLTIDGSQMPKTIMGGPAVCQTDQGGNPSPFLCYQPSASNILNITQSPTALATILVEPPKALALSSGSGIDGSMAITNTSNQLTALNIHALLPLGSDILQDATHCLSVPAGNTCFLKFSPGPTEHALEILTIQGTNTNSVTATLVVLPASSITVSWPSSPALPTLPVGGSIVFTVTNIGSIAATISYTIPPEWDDVSVTTLGCASVALLHSCTITLTSPTPHIAGLVSIQTTDPLSTPLLTPLAFSYPSGLVFYADGSTAKIVSNNDDGLLVPWYSAPYFTSTAQNNTNGMVNTSDIMALGSCTSATNCAAWICFTKAPALTWYLPAICEMGHQGEGTNCPESSTAPTIDANLFQLGYLPELNNRVYWSSTEVSETPEVAWYQLFSTGPGDSFQNNYIQSAQVGVRCTQSIAY
ncbi:MAG: hypothetical protein NTW94_01590 [Legionellales bacterium]|nr:hypothetical protein [Legionellales bacterium]